MMKINNNILIKYPNYKFSSLNTSKVSFQAHLKLPNSGQNASKSGFIKFFISAVGLNRIIGTKKSNSLGRIFQKLYDFKGDNVDFAQLAFNKIAKYLGLKSLLPKKIIVTDALNETGAATFRWRTGEFTIDKTSCQEATKASILNSIRHELEHYLQYEKIIRAEGIGIEKISKLEAEKELKNYKGDFFEAHIPEEYLPEKRYRSDEGFINVINNAINKKFWQKVIKKRGIIKSGTSDAKKALEYLNAHLIYPRKNNYAQNYCKTINMPYEVPHGFNSIYKKDKYHYQYVTNPLEVDARKTGKDIQEQYLDFESRITDNPRYIDEEAVEVQRIDQLQLDSIKQFDDVFEQKFGKYNLPENFKGYMYFQALSKDSSSTQNILDAIKAAPQNIKEMDKKSILPFLDLYEFILKRGDIRLRSQDEIDKVNRFIQEYRAENA